MVSVVAGNTILASHFNEFMGRVDSLYRTGSGNKGYGQSALPPVGAVIAGGLAIDDASWNDLRTMARALATHLNRTSTFDGNWPTVTAGSSTILASYVNNIETAIADLETNHLLPLNVLGYSTNSSVLSMTRGDQWSGTIYGEFQIDFTSEDHARYFFNTGGMITLRFEQTTNVSDFDAAWVNVFSNVSSLRLTANNYTSTNSIGANTGGGFYNLTDISVADGTVRWDGEAGAPYGQVGTGIGSAGIYQKLDVESSLYRLNYTGANGGNGRTIVMRFSCYEDASNEFNSQVSAGTRAHIGIHRATSTGLSVYPAAPTITIKTNW